MTTAHTRFGKEQDLSSLMLRYAVIDLRLNNASKKTLPSVHQCRASIRRRKKQHLL